MQALSHSSDAAALVHGAIFACKTDGTVKTEPVFVLAADGAVSFNAAMRSCGASCQFDLAEVLSCASTHSSLPPRWIKVSSDSQIPWYSARKKSLFVTKRS
jgi:hypothetical protein